MKYKNKTHIIFDLDDTLTNSYSFNQDMFVETFRPYVAQLNKANEDYLRQLHQNSRGTSMVNQFQQAVDRIGLKVSPTVLVAENETLHTNNADKIQIFSHVKKLLERHQSKGKILSICTNRQTQSTTKILKNNNIEKYFTQIVSCSDAGHEKPDPFCLNKLIGEFQIPKDSVLYIGDSTTDELFAKNAGVEFELAQN